MTKVSTLSVFLLFYNFVISLFGTVFFVVLRDSAFLILNPKRLIWTRVCQVCGSPRNPTAMSARFFYHWTGLLRPVDLFTACFYLCISFLFLFSWYCVLKRIRSSGASTRMKHTCRIQVGPWSWTSESLPSKEGAGKIHNRLKVLFLF